jgi:hypothetical protein
VTDAASTSGAQSEHEFMFGSDLAPDIAIGGIDVFRSMLTFEPGPANDDTQIQWEISGFRSGNPMAPIILLGDLTCTARGWRATTTVVGHITAKRDRTDELKDTDAAEALVLALGAWASSALYDSAAGALRHILASNHGAKLTVPVVTPRATLNFTPERR